MPERGAQFRGDCYLKLKLSYELSELIVDMVVAGDHHRDVV